MTQNKSFTLQEIADLTDSCLIGNPDQNVSGVNTLESAEITDASFLANPRYTEMLKTTKAGVVCISTDEPQIPNKNYLVSEDPSKCFQKIVEILLPFSRKLSGFEQIHQSATIHPTAKISDNVTIGPNAVIDQNAIVGENSFIGANTYVGPLAKIGNDCVLHPNSVVRERCVLHNRVILQPGAIIGSCGFGYIPNAEGQHIKLDQVGIVILEDDVEIGANTTIDRARFDATIVKKGSKIDNLVQIAHNVQIGESNVIAAQTGIAGSSKTGKYVMMGGQVGILGHVELADGAMIATRAGVSKSLPQGQYRGSPAISIEKYHKEKAHVRRLAKYVKRIDELERKLQELENKLSSKVGQ